MSNPEPVGLLAYMAKRGYSTSSALAILRRLFLESWAEPGFHNFWRVWNPVYGYFLMRLYLALGGNRRALLNQLIVFAACGFFLHDLIGFAFTGALAFGTTFAFLFFGLLAALNRGLARHLHQERWPPLLNAALNLGLVVLGLVAGHHVDRLLP